MESDLSHRDPSHLLTASFQHQSVVFTLLSMAVLCPIHFRQTQMIIISRDFLFNTANPLITLIILGDISRGGSRLSSQGAHLKKSRRAERGAKIIGVFRVKSHDFTQKNHIFSNFRGCVPPLESAPDQLHSKVGSTNVNNTHSVNFCNSLGNC